MVVNVLKDGTICKDLSKCILSQKNNADFYNIINNYKKTFVTSSRNREGVKI